MSGSALDRRQILQAGAAIGALSAAGLPTATAYAQTPKRGGVIRIGFIGTPALTDPHRTTGTEENAVWRAVYDSLVFTDPQLRPQPELAASWEVTPDSTTWTFALRRGVRFHHGRELDAEDVVWSFKRILDPATASPARSVLSIIRSVEALDKHTVRFVLNGPFAEFATLLGGNFQAKIAPRDVPSLQKTPTGTGPFKLTEFVPGDHATLVRNDAYWRDGQPYVNEVRHVYLPEEPTHVAGMLSGSLDMTYSPPPELLPIYLANPAIQVRTVETNGYQPIVMRVDQPPFNDPRVREAFKLICDREALTRVVLGGLKVPVSNDHPIPPNSPAYMAQSPRKQDINAAKALLAEAGYRDGMDIEMMAWTGRAGLVQSALAFQDMAKKANVRISVKTVPADIFLAKFWLKHNFFVTNWTARSTLYELLAIAYRSDARWNESQWKSAEMDALIDGVRSELDDAKRMALFAEVQKRFIADGPVIVPYHRPRVTALRKHVQGFEPHPGGTADMRTAWLA